MFFYVLLWFFLAQVVVDGMAGTVVTNLELRAGFLGLVVITQTESERRQREQRSQRVRRTFHIAIFPL